MSMHKIQLTELEIIGLKNHRLPIGTPSQLSDCFRSGMKWALDNAVPEGWKLVPVEPTEEMVDAFIDSDIDFDPEQNVIIGYKAMLAAAPEAK